MKNVDKNIKGSSTKWLLMTLAMMLINFSSFAQTVHEIPNTIADTLALFVEDTSKWEPGDIIKLEAGSTYLVSGTIEIYQSVVIMGDAGNHPMIQLQDNGFNVKGDSIDVTIKSVDFDGYYSDGVNENIAPFILRYSGGDAEGAYDLVHLEDIYAKNFKGGVDLNASKQRWYKKVLITNVYFDNFDGSEWVLDPNLNVIKDLEISNSTFSTVGAFLKNVYFNKDGTDIFGDVDQNLVVDHNTFFQIGDNNNSLIQLNDQNDGNLTFTFSNNIVSTVLNNENTRLFRLNEQAGVYNFKNSIFHSFIPTSPDKDQFSLDSVSSLSNVFLTDVTLDADYPEFADTTSSADPKSFMLPASSPLLTFGTDGGAIGDPQWAPVNPGLESDNIHPVPSDADSLEHFLEALDVDNKPLYWKAGDTILLVSAGTYVVNGTIDLYDEVTVMGDPTLSVKPTLQFNDNGFRAKEDTISITLKGFNMNGLKEGGGNAGYVLRFDQAGFQNYNNIVIEDMEAYNFLGGVQLYKNGGTLYESFTMNNVFFHDMMGDFVIDPRLNAVEELKITNSTFTRIKSFFKNVYNDNDGDKPMGVVPQNILIDHNTFYDVITDILIQTNDSRDGSITFTWSNNIVSKLTEQTNTRPFRIEHDEAGTFVFKNSVFHDFISTRDPGAAAGYNLDSLEVLSNVTISDIYTDYPDFADTASLPHNLSLPLSTPLIDVSTTGGPIGDPRWFPEVGVSITPLTEVVYNGYDVQMEAEATFAEGTDLSVTWTVEDGTGSATISESGLLTGTSEGEVVVYATSVAFPTYKDSLVVEIVAPLLVTDISVRAENSFNTEVSIIDQQGGSVTVIATILPVNATDANVTWSLDDETLATIDSISPSRIRINAVASGVLTVTATSVDGSEISASKEITITRQNPPTGYTVTTESGETSVSVDGTLQMVAARTPEDSDDEGVAWSITSGGSSATISESGLLTATSAGTVTVQAASGDAQNFGAKGTLEITVTPPLGLDPANDLVSIFPNPATNAVNINIDGRASVKVTNLSGQVMLSKELNGKSSLDISSLRSGLYIISVATDDSFQTIKFTKE